MRITVRRLMSAVAVVALMTGGAIEATRLQRCRASHLRDAAHHARREAEERRNLAVLD